MPLGISILRSVICVNHNFHINAIFTIFIFYYFKHASLFFKFVLRSYIGKPLCDTFLCLYSNRYLNPFQILRKRFLNLNWQLLQNTNILGISRSFFDITICADNSESMSTPQSMQLSFLWREVTFFVFFLMIPSHLNRVDFLVSHNAPLGRAKIRYSCGAIRIRRLPKFLPR